MMTIKASRILRHRTTAPVCLAVCLAICLAACLAPGGRALAAPMTEDQVKTAVETWVHTTTPDARPGAVVERLDPYPATGRTAAYVAHLAGGGYCLAGADDRLPPVRLYQPHDYYRTDIPDLEYLLQDSARRLELIEAAEATKDAILVEYAETLAWRRERWAALSSGVRTPRRDAVKSGGIPLTLTLDMTSTWHQGSPYNDLCPELTPSADEHVLVGCVATAAAQIMRYWEWPRTLSGASTIAYNRHYTDDWISEYLHDPVVIPPKFAGRLEWVADTVGGYLRMNGWWDESILGKAMEIPGGYQYTLALWDLFARMETVNTNYIIDHSKVSIAWEMLDDEHADPPGIDDIEVAELCYHVAAASNMQFGLWFSGAYDRGAYDAYVYHCGYDADCDTLDLNPVTMVHEIAWQRPVQLGGHGTLGGHSWVAFGYDMRELPTQFLMNLGWGGAPDWQEVDELFPDDQSMIVYISPASVIRYVSSGLFGGDGTPAQPYANLAVAAAQAPDDATLIFATGCESLFPGTTATVDRPMTLRGIDVTIRPE